MSHHQDCLPLTHVPPWLYLGALAALLLLCMLMAVTWGSANLHAGDVWRVLWHQLPGTAQLPIDNDHRIVWLIRMPRVLLAALVDRGGRELPVAADFVAASVELSKQENLQLQRADDGRFSLTVVHA